MFARLFVQNLSIAIGDRQLVQQLNWQVHAGECWCVIGRNGVGKTTLLRYLTGLIPLGSNAGQIVVNGQKLAHWSLRELAKQRAYLPQGRHDVFGYRVIDTVLAARYAYTEGHYWDSAENVGIANDALSQLDVADLAERDVRSLSGGERQRVAIAALLAQNAPLMLLDEPGNALDLPHQIRAMQLISDGCRVQQKSVVMVSHDVNLVYRIATHALLLMPDGSWQAGRASEIMNPSMLAECLGHPIERVQHGKHQVFLPV